MEQESELRGLLRKSVDQRSAEYSERNRPGSDDLHASSWRWSVKSDELPRLGDQV